MIINVRIEFYFLTKYGNIINLDYAHMSLTNILCIKFYCHYIILNDNQIYTSHYRYLIILDQKVIRTSSLTFIFEDNQYEVFISKLDLKLSGINAEFHVNE